jgi:dienelactone hydrolase
MEHANALRHALVATVGLTVLLAGCSSGSSSPATTTTAVTAPAKAPYPYQHPGPDPVGVTTLDLGSAGSTYGERYATVYYPTTTAAAVGHARYSYTEASTLPTAYQAVLPAQYNITTTLDAYLAPQAAPNHYPVVLFSHGYGGERLYYSNLLVGIASWGYVVVSADYLERGLAAQVLQSKTKPTAAQDSATMATSLRVLLGEAGSSSSVLHDAANPNLVAAVGHSAGGGTAENALNVPNVKTAVGWAPVPPTGQPSTKPVMLIGAEGDTVVPPSSVTSTYDNFHGPKALVEISGEGHNTYTDICTGIRSGGGLISYAVAHHFTTPQLAKFGINGCSSSDLPAQQFWPIVQYYTVIQLKNQLGGDSGATIPLPAPNQFPGFTVHVTQQR